MHARMSPKHRFLPALLGGFDCYHFDSKVSLNAATAAAAGRMTLMGNLNDPGSLLWGTPEEIAAGVQILARECATLLRTPTPVLQLLVEVVSHTGTEED